MILRIVAGMPWERAHAGRSLQLSTYRIPWLLTVTGHCSQGYIGTEYPGKIFSKTSCASESQVQLPAMAKFAVSAHLLALMLCFNIASSMATGNATRNSTMGFHSPGLEHSSKSQDLPFDTIVDTASISSSSSHAVGLGGFIAQGLGMSTYTENSITTTAVPRTRL